MIDRGIAVPAIFIAVAYLLLTAWNLNIETIASPDEPRYAVPAREMIRGGDWIIPKFNHQPRILKPILFYWVIAAAGMIGEAAGLSLATAMRVGPLLAGLATVLAAFLLGRRLISPRGGFIAAFVLMTAQKFHGTARELVVDMTLCAFLLWAWLLCHIALEKIARKESAFLPLLGFYISLGLACLTKGPPLVAMFVVVPLVIYLFWTGRLWDLKKAGLWWGIPLALVLGCWWIFAVQSRSPEIWEVYKTENFSRAIGNKDHQHKAPLLFYILDLGNSFLPWVAAIPFVAVWSVRNFSRLKSDGSDESAKSSAENAKFLACCLGIPFLILGVIISKRALYLVPLYPFIAIWIAWGIEKSFLAPEGTPISKWLFGGVLGFAGLLFASVGALWLVPAFAAASAGWGFEKSDLVLLSSILCAAAIILYRAALSGRRGFRYLALLQILAVACALSIGYESVIRPAHERRADSVNFYASLNEKLAGRPMVMFGESVNEAIWFLNRGEKDGKVDFATHPMLKAKFFESPGTVLVAKESELKATEGLAEAVFMDPASAEPRIKRGSDWFILALPNPAHPPAESVFKAKSKHAASSDATEE